jgi:aminoglycoside N3'-acetyltransferase
MTAATIDVGKLFELVWASLGAGVVVAACFSLVVIGVTRAADCRHHRRSGSATAYAALSAVSTVVFLGIAVFAISVIAAK